MFDHEKYPIICGATYVNEEGVQAILIYAELLPKQNDAKIILDTQNKGCMYHLNYATFTYYWKLLK